MSDVIQRLNCIETSDGFVISWDIAEGEQVVRSTIYGINGAREFVIESPLTSTGRFIIRPENYSLAESFKVGVATADGRIDIQGPVSPQRMTKAERLLINDMRRRAEVYMKSSPIGSYPCRVLLRRMDGPRCLLCGNHECSGHGGLPITDHCPECLGTGISNPYYCYPSTVLFHGVTPKDDNPVSQNPATQRSHVTRAFQSVFPIPLRVSDIIVTGTEAYKIVDQKISASVGNVPVYYNVSVIKIAPEDPKYPTLMNIAFGGCDL